MILIKKNSDPNFFLINVRSHTKEGFGKLINASHCADPILAENILPQFIYSEDFFKNPTIYYIEHIGRPWST